MCHLTIVLVTISTIVLYWSSQNCESHQILLLSTFFCLQPLKFDDERTRETQNDEMMKTSQPGIFTVWYPRKWAIMWIVSAWDICVQFNQRTHIGGLVNEEALAWNVFMVRKIWAFHLNECGDELTDWLRDVGKVTNHIPSGVNKRNW